MHVISVKERKVNVKRILMYKVEETNLSINFKDNIEESIFSILKFKNDIGVIITNRITNGYTLKSTII